MKKLQAIVSLAKRRGFVFPGSEIYGGLANTWDWGPLGTELVRNIKDLWWNMFVREREEIFGLRSGILMNSKVWEASGHLKNFTDPLAECKKCRKRYRADHFTKCPSCDEILTDPRQFNLMFKTHIGPVGEFSSAVYLRPETAQGMFVNYKNVLETMRPKLPFGIAQIGKVFRNEITPGNFIFRVLEFEQMEIEYFIEEKNWRGEFKNWRRRMETWLNLIGINKKNHSVRIHQKDELSHYSKKTIDFEYKYPFGTKELYGLAYRTDYDLKAHNFKNPPHVIEPSFGVERTVLAILCDGYKEEGKRVVLKLSPRVAPYKAAVFPLLANKARLTELARRVYEELKAELSVLWDDRGNIGKRYYSQDEIGTPYCLTIDFDSLKKKDLTVRDRDSMKQKRIKIKDIKTYLKERIG